MNLNQLFCDFANGILSRTQRLTEDSIRYYFFNCMLRQDINLDHYVLEFPYALMKITNLGGIHINSNSHLKNSSRGLGQELDLYHEDNEIICAEFKFHRGSGKSTARAGELFNDMRRLQLFSSPTKRIHRLLVYITDDEMHKYLLWKSQLRSIPTLRAGLRDFYSTGGQFRYAVPIGKSTFYDNANKSFSSKDPIDVTASLLFSLSSTHKLLNNCHISVFEVSPISNKPTQNRLQSAKNENKSNGKEKSLHLRVL